MKTFFSVVILFAAVITYSQNSRVERSGKLPQWVNKVEKDFIIVMGEGASVQDAQRVALHLVKGKITQQVAQGYKSAENITGFDEPIRKNVDNYLQKYTSSNLGPASTQGAFFQTINLADAGDVYWEKHQDNRNNIVRYFYHIKYPFSEEQLAKLVADFQRRDQELTEKLSNLISTADHIVVVEQIEHIVSELKILSDYFFDNRKERTLNAIYKFRNLYDRIELVEVHKSEGEIQYTLRLGNDFITSSQRPQITSDCARVTGTSYSGKNIIIHYEIIPCPGAEKRGLLVRYRFGNSNVQKEFIL